MKIEQPEWEVKLDEFHPDPRVAARYADQNARIAQARYLNELIERLENLPERQPQQDETLGTARGWLADIEAAIDNFKQEEA